MENNTIQPRRLSDDLNLETNSPLNELQEHIPGIVGSTGEGVTVRQEVPSGFRTPLRMTGTTRAAVCTPVQQERAAQRAAQRVEFMKTERKRTIEITKQGRINEGPEPNFHDHDKKNHFPPPPPPSSAIPVNA